MEQEEIKAKNLAISGLINAASKVNDSLGAFSGWLVAGVGGAFSILLASYEIVSRFICASNIRIALFLLIVGLIVAIVARFLSAMVSSAVGSHCESTAQISKFIESGESFDVEVFLKEFQKGLFPYQRWISGKTIEKVKSGDLVAGARYIAKLSQIQALLVLVEMAFVIGSAIFLVVGLK